jgi:predicted DCC family thiol-disulfide oxidoreductase YuxK
MSAARRNGPIILFDGVCNLCHAAVRFILAHDRDSVFRFAPLESPTGREIIGDGLADGRSVDSVILVQDGATYVRSDAVIRIFAQLGLPWRALGVLRIVPRPLREAAYQFIAPNRYRWFGRKDICPRPDGEFRDRFLS